MTIRLFRTPPPEPDPLEYWVAYLRGELNATDVPPPDRDTGAPVLDEADYLATPRADRIVDTVAADPGRAAA